MDTEIDRPRRRFTLDHRFRRDRQLGVEYYAAVGEIDLSSNWFLGTETVTRPALVLGPQWSKMIRPLQCLLSKIHGPLQDLMGPALYEYSSPLHRLTHSDLLIPSIVP